MLQKVLVLWNRIMEIPSKGKEFWNSKKPFSKRTIIITIVIGIVVVGVIVFLGVRSYGKSSLYKSSTSVPVIDLFGEGDDDWEEGWILYKGEIYEYNQEILTFLVMGIDKLEEVEEAEDGISGGQSDAMFLLVCNPLRKEIEVIAIHRDTMTEINMYDKEGELLGEAFAQITLQHGYGDGLELSCERSVEAVSNLLYQLPIHGYASLNIGSVEELTDAIGGVEVTIQEDMIIQNKYRYKQGETVLLTGEEAYWYVRDRDVTTFESANNRLSRQKQYLTAFIPKVLSVVKSDLSVVTNLYQVVKEYLVTDISLNELTYMASTFASYGFDMSNMHTLVGETVQGEVFEEFYIDEDALYELIVEIYYEKLE